MLSFGRTIATSLSKYSTGFSAETAEQHALVRLGFLVEQSNVDRQLHVLGYLRGKIEFPIESLSVDRRNEFRQDSESETVAARSKRTERIRSEYSDLSRHVSR